MLRSLIWTLRNYIEWSFDRSHCMAQGCIVANCWSRKARPIILICATFSYVSITMPFSYTTETYIITIIFCWLCESEYNLNLRHQSVVALPKFKTITYGKKSFRYFGAHVWNSVPPHTCIGSPPTFKRLKGMIKSWLVPSCDCVLWNVFLWYVHWIILQCMKSLSPGSACTHHLMSKNSVGANVNYFTEIDNK